MWRNAGKTRHVGCFTSFSRPRQLMRLPFRGIPELIRRMCARRTDLRVLCFLSFLMQLRIFYGFIGEWKGGVSLWANGASTFVWWRPTGEVGRETKTFLLGQEKSYEACWWSHFISKALAVPIWVVDPVD